MQPWTLLLLILGFSTPALAATVTEVADALDEQRVGRVTRRDAFDMTFHTSFEQRRTTGVITREQVDRIGVTDPDCSPQTPRGCTPVDELSYSRVISLMRIASQIGIYRDLAFTIDWSIILRDTSSFAYADDVDATTSTLDPAQGATLIPHDASFHRAGSGPLTLGVRWAPLNDERDETRAAWVLYTRWTNPWTTQTYGPNQAGTRGSPAQVGDGVHYLTFGTSLSKRMARANDYVWLEETDNRRGYLEPYFDINYSVPIPQDGPALDANVKSDDNPFGHPPPHQAHGALGMEIVPYEDLMNQTKFTIDLGIEVDYFSNGRQFTVVSGPLRELTFSEQYASLQGGIGLRFQPSEFVTLSTGFAWGYITEHLLTFEEAGRDRNGDGTLTFPEDEFNPYYCGQDVPQSTSDACSVAGTLLDQVGYRLRAERNSQLTWRFGAQVNF